MIECEYCNNLHDGSYASGRFCGLKCSRGFSTKNKRKIINLKVSKKLSGRKVPIHIVEKTVASRKYNDKIRYENGDKVINIEDYINNEKNITNQKLKNKLYKLGLKEKRCESCSVGLMYNNKPLTLQLHHIDGNNKNNSLNNLMILCPNCHSQTHNYAGKKS